MSVDMTVENTAKYHSWPAKPGLLPAARSLSRVSVDVKAGLYQLGSRGGSLKKKKKRARQTGNRSVRVGPNLPGQVGAPLEHTVHHQNHVYCTVSLTVLPRATRTSKEAVSLHPRRASELLSGTVVVVKRTL